MFFSATSVVLWTDNKPGDDGGENGGGSSTIGMVQPRYLPFPFVFVICWHNIHRSFTLAFVMSFIKEKRVINGLH